MTPEEIHQLATKIYESLNRDGVDLHSWSLTSIERAIERFIDSPNFCEALGCYADPEYEGWHRAGTMIRKMRVCKEHMHLLIGKEITE